MIFVKILFVILQIFFMMLAFGMGGTFVKMRIESDTKNQKRLSNAFSVVWILSALLSIGLAIL